MLAPVYRLLFDEYKLSLTEDQIVINYKTYEINEADDMQEIVDQKLTPGKNHKFRPVCKLNCENSAHSDTMGLISALDRNLTFSCQCFIWPPRSG